MNINVNLDLKRVYSIDEATHILALKDYGNIKKDDIVEIYSYCGLNYVWDMGAFPENELLNEIEDNILLKMEANLR